MGKKFYNLVTFELLFLRNNLVKESCTNDIREMKSY